MQQQLTLMSFADRPACWIGTLKSVSAATNYEVITGFFSNLMCSTLSISIVYSGDSEDLM